MLNYYILILLLLYFKHLNVYDFKETIEFY